MGNLYFLGKRGVFGVKRLIYSLQLYAFPKTAKIQLICSVQSYQLIFFVTERTLCNNDSGVARVAPSDRPVRDQNDQEGQDGRGHGFRGPRSLERARGR